MRRIVSLVVAILLLGLTSVPVGAAAPLPATPSDFNGDGYVDLAIGVPGDLRDAGAVNVIYGSLHGLTSAGDQVWTQGSPGVKGTPASSIFDAFEGDQFGAALASGDFDADGFADLAIGVPHDLLRGVEEVGAVNVLYGSAHGLTADGDQLWNHENLPDIASSRVMGLSLAAADFSGDGVADLAIGTWQNPGVVDIVLGSSRGLTATGSILLSASSPGFPGDPATRAFGYKLATGDFDGDGHEDLVAADNDATMAGQVDVIYGDTSPIDFERSETWSQDSIDVLDIAEAGDEFGESLAVGDFDADGRDDLAIGVLESTTAYQDGAVNILYGSVAGLTADGNQFWHQDSAGVPGVGESADDFARALAAGDFDSDGADDLAIGVSNEGVGTRSGQGMIDVLYGDSVVGLSAVGAQSWTQDSPGVPGSGERYDSFGEQPHRSRLWPFGTDGPGHRRPVRTSGLPAERRCRRRHLRALVRPVWVRSPELGAGLRGHQGIVPEWRPLRDRLRALTGYTRGGRVAEWQTRRP